MRIYTEQQPWLRSVAIYILDDRGDRSMVLPPFDGRTVLESWVPIDQGTQPKPTLVLQWDVFEALAKAMLGEVDPDVGVVAHLKDAIGVRDRLLALVESQYEARP